VPPSRVKKLNTSILLAPVDIVGGDELGHLTEAGHVSTLEPVASCLQCSVKLYAIPDAGGLENVTAIEALARFKLNMLESAKSIVVAFVDIVAVLTVSLYDVNMGLLVTTIPPNGARLI